VSRRAAAPPILAPIIIPLFDSLFELIDGEIVGDLVGVGVGGENLVGVRVGGVDLVGICVGDIDLVGGDVGGGVLTLIHNRQSKLSLPSSRSVLWKWGERADSTQVSSGQSSFRSTQCDRPEHPTHAVT